EERASVLTAYNLASALAIAAGALLGAAIFRALGGSQAGFAAIFGVSAALRLLTLPLLVRLRAPGPPAAGAPRGAPARRPPPRESARPVLKGEAALARKTAAAARAART